MGYAWSLCFIIVFTSSLPAKVRPLALSPGYNEADPTQSWSAYDRKVNQSKAVLRAKAKAISSLAVAAAVVVVLAKQQQQQALLTSLLLLILMLIMMTTSCALARIVGWLQKRSSQGLHS